MQYTEQQLEDFKAEFAKRRKRQLLVSLPVVAAILIVAVASENAKVPLFGLPPAVAGAIAFAAILGTLVFSLSNWRCPACNKYLGKGIGPSFCPRCGVPLR
jgi:fatty acid desaturase